MSVGVACNSCLCAVQIALKIHLSQALGATPHLELAITLHSCQKPSFLYLYNPDPELQGILSQLFMQVDYMPSHQVARSLAFTPRCLSLLTGNVFFNAGSKRYNLGLAIKDVANQMCVLDYAKQQDDQRGWTYSHATLQVLQAYKASLIRTGNHLSCNFLSPMKPTDLIFWRNGNTDTSEQCSSSLQASCSKTTPACTGTVSFLLCLADVVLQMSRRGMAG